MSLSTPIARADCIDNPKLIIGLAPTGRTDFRIILKVGIGQTSGAVRAFLGLVRVILLIENAKVLRSRIRCRSEVIREEGQRELSAN